MSSSNSPKYTEEAFHWGPEDGGASASPIRAALTVGEPVGRRTVLSSLAVLAGGAGATAALSMGTQPVLATSHAEEWIAEGASIVTYDGSIDEITFGDPDESGDPEGADNALGVEWDGFSSSSTAAEFDVLLRGSPEDEEGWAAGADEFESILVDGADGAVTLSGNSGSEEYTWEDVFGMHQPASVGEHPEIAMADFEESEGGEERVRTVDVRLAIDVPDEDLEVTVDAEATISVTNLEATITIGGQGTFEITSSEEA